MSSPAKKRKLNHGSKTSNVPSKGLEYFFNKQKQDASSPTTPQPEPTKPDSELTDEELARKLQDEWNQEAFVSGRNGGGVSNGDENVKNETTETSLAEKTATDDIGFRHVDGDASTSTVKTSQNNGKKTLTLQSAGAIEDSVTSSIPLDESPLKFDPSQYVGELQAAWKAEGGDATYALLTRCFVLVSSTQSRIKIVDTLVNCLRVLIEADPSSLLPAVIHMCPPKTIGLTRSRCG